MRYTGKHLGYWGSYFFRVVYLYTIELYARTVQFEHTCIAESGIALLVVSGLNGNDQL